MLELTSPKPRNIYLIDHRVGGCVDERVLLGAPEVRRVGGLAGVNGGGGEGLGLGLHCAGSLAFSFVQLEADLGSQHFTRSVSNREVKFVALVDFAVLEST